MTDLNITTVCGRIVRDPEIRYTAGSMAIGSITIAANRTWKDATGNEREECAFVPVTVFGKPAEWLADHKKGELVIVSGRLRTDSWEKNGQKQSRLVLIADHIQFTQRSSGGGTSSSKPSTGSKTSTFEKEGDDEIPF